jgi:tRNA threonylcarbamoyladenosine biosynthesis protein TsaB
MSLTAGGQPARDEDSDANELRPWLLAIDTATEQAGIALFDGVQLAEMSWPGGRRQTTSVLPAIQSMLQMIGIDLNCVGGVAVSLGPGSFTGLRVGMSLAKGFVIDGNRELVGIPTLDVSAFPYLATGAGCIALVPAGRARVVWSIYPEHGEPTPPQNMTFDGFLEILAPHPNHVVVGELTPEQRNSVLKVHAKIATPAMSTRRPAILAEIGYRRWTDRDIVDPATVEPLYLHGQPNPR